MNPTVEGNWCWYWSLHHLGAGTAGVEVRVKGEIESALDLGEREGPAGVSRCLLDESVRVKESVLVLLGPIYFSNAILGRPKMVGFVLFAVTDAAG